jgi:uncharacterized protein with FMN-binding domain
LSGLAVIGSSIGIVHILQNNGPPAMASINGSFPPRCSVQAASTTCASSDQGQPRATHPHPSRYRDGIYAATGHYETPGGSETLGVTIRVSGGMVSGATVRVEARSPTARQFQEQFASRYADFVVSRPLSDVDVSRVAGASLTSVGFDRAVAEIRLAADV